MLGRFFEAAAQLAAAVIETMLEWVLGRGGPASSSLNKTTQLLFLGAAFVIVGLILQIRHDAPHLLSGGFIGFGILFGIIGWCARRQG